MRSLSSIIKNSDLVFTHPIIIDTSQKQAEVLDEILEDMNRQEELPETDPLEALREESNQILAETEHLIIDLLEKARTEAQGIIKDAQEEADYVRSQVMEESKAIRDKALQQAYAEGLKKAQNDIEADRQMAMDQSKQILEEAFRNKIEILNGLEKDMVRLVLSIAKKVIVADLRTQPSAIVEIVRQAITNLDSPENMRIYLNPADIESITEAIDWGGLTEIGSRDIHLEIKTDPRISQGGVIIESAGGAVDARLETRLNSVEKAFLDVVNE